MAKRISIIQGHPDSREGHFCHALGWTYEAAAVEAGHQVRTIDVARLDFPLIRTREDFEQGKVPDDILAAQEDIRWANHLVICYPLWLGTLPALLKGFFEQTFRYGYALDIGGKTGRVRKLLKGRSARIIVTMGMPAAVYRYYFRAHGLKSLESGILAISGIAPIRATLVGSVEKADTRHRARALAEVRKLGSRAQ
jgi:putative NADPH-quinone reductase